MYQPRNLLTNQVIISGKVRRIYRPNTKCILVDVLTGTSPSDNVQIVLYPTLMALLDSLRIQEGVYIRIEGNIQSSYHNSGRSTQSVIANSLTKLYTSPMDERSHFQNRFEAFGDIESIELKDRRYGFDKILIHTKRDGRVSHFLLSILPEAIQNGMPRIGEKHRFVGEILTVQSFSPDGRAMYTQAYLVHTII